MPIRAARSIVKQLSNYYYKFGQLIASRTYLLLLISLSFISYFSSPTITKYLYDVSTTRNNIPLSHISTSLDAQCWHASAHVEFNNFSLSRHPPSTYLITEQIRLSHPNKPVSFELIQQAQIIYETISTILLQGTDAPISLSTICYKHKGQCLIHAPPFYQFQTEQDWRSTTRLDNQLLPYEHHPYSVYSNATFDQQGRFLKADAVLLTFVLNQTQHGNTLHTWNRILQQVKTKYQIIDIEQQQQQEGGQSFIWSASSNISPHMIQYKFNLFPFDVPMKVQLSVIAYFMTFYVVSMLFGKYNLVKSGYTFGLAAVFLSIACFTTTWGIFDKLGISFHSVPWYLLLLVINIGSLENIFLLTNAVLDAGCDMIVKEKISRGLQSVGVPMTATLIAELLILSVGTYMDSDLIREFCIFTKVALLVDYFLQLTFVIAILSIDIKRVELADLDDRQISKRLHELQGFDHEKERQQTDFCPIQDTENKDDSKSCAECKEFKTHRVFNSFMLCLLLLLLSLFSSKDHYQHASTALASPFVYQPDLNQLSDQFWSTVNPQKDITWLQIQPPHLFIYDADTVRVKHHLDYLQHLYQVKSTAVRYKIEHRPSLFRLFVLSTLQKILVLVLKINVPVLILCLVMIAIITWMMPKWRNEWLVPLLIHCFNQFFLTISKYLPVKRLYLMYVKGQVLDGNANKEYDTDGIHHRGAITVQNIFNQQQYRANVKTVQVRTLTNQHIADIQSLDANGKQSLVSCGQDGRVVLWNANKEKATWTARLDKLYPTRGGTLQALLNGSKKRSKNNSVVSLSKDFFSKPRALKVDQGNKWIAGAYEDGLIRIWNVHTGTLVREMEMNDEPHMVQQEPTLRHRFSSSPERKASRGVDRIVALQFMGVVPEFCHPLIAEVAARCGSDNNASQNYVVSAHKSGVLHEWDILSGECIQTIQTGHTRDITQLHVVDSKAPHRKFGVSWVFTASKDGLVKCWERKLAPKKTTEDKHVDNDDEYVEEPATSWMLAYTIKQTSAVTSIATEFPVGGMGVLVTGTSDGTVKVWNFETGEPVCTLSLGKAVSSSSSMSSSSSTCVSDSNVFSREGGPIRRFAKFSMASSYMSSSSSSDDDDDDENDASLSDHRSAIYQVTVTRYCEVENGPGLCRGCDTCFGNGFLVASNSMDHKVHAWRLERADSGHEGSCTLCTKDYHRKQYKHRKASMSSEDDVTHSQQQGRRRRASSVKKSTVKKRTKQDDLLELLDIEQLAGDARIPLKPTFLGKVEQPAGRGIVFCDKILAGVRRRRNSLKKEDEGEWEAWFASLQYYDPLTDDDEEQQQRWKIPIETFDLDSDRASLNAMTAVEEKEEDPHKASQLLKSTLMGLFTSNSAVSDPLMKYKGGIHAVKKKASYENDALEEVKEEEEMEASENLPFSTIRHVISLDGAGLACDYGNFIKLVYLDKPSLTEKEKLKMSRDEPKMLVEVIEEDEGCQCEGTNKEDCCGGVNKAKNGGKCCGGISKQKKKKKPAIIKKQPLASGCNVRSITECSIRNNCSRASECVSTSQAIASSASVSSFSNWL